MMARALSETVREKRKPSTIQCASTQATLDRDPRLDELHSKRSINIAAAQADRYYTRPISAEEYAACGGNKKHGLGALTKSSVSDEKKEKAVDAFIYSQPAPLNEVEVMELTKIEPIIEVKKIEVWKPMTFWQAMWHRLKGNKIKLGDEDEN